MRDVKARSCGIIGTFLGSFTLKRSRGGPHLLLQASLNGNDH
jgi:hypothetical protein